jgi:hypothetical protein
MHLPGTFSYASLEDFKAFLGVNDTVDDVAIQGALDTATSAIEQYTGRVFWAQDTVATPRIFDADMGAAGYGYGPPGPPFGWFFGASWQIPGVNRLHVPDVGVVTAIDLDLALDGSFSTSLPSSSWMLYPLNVGQPGVNGNYTQIRLRPTAPYAFWPGYQIRVTGMWGWPTADAPPQAVLAANVLLANRYWRRSGAPFAIWEGPQMGQLAILPTLDPDVVQLLGPYRTTSVSPEWVLA